MNQEAMSRHKTSNKSYLETLKLFAAGAASGVAFIGVLASFSTEALGLAIVGRFLTAPTVEALALVLGGLAAFVSSRS